MLDLSIIIVNYNSCALTQNGLRSIYKHKPNISFEVIVVDNNSTDNSKKKLREEFQDTIWIQNETNEGFGRANNIGAHYAKGNFLLFLNSDVLVKSDTIENLFINFSNEEKHVGAATCQLINPDGSLQKSTFHSFASFLEVLSYNLLIEYLFSIKKKLDAKRSIKALHGACFMIKKETFVQVGGFDQDFFMYSEEFELCSRLIDKHYELKLYPDLKLVHLDEGSSTDRNWNRKQRKASLALLFKKRRKNLGLLFYLVLIMLNAIMNFMLLWRMEKLYRRNFHNDIMLNLSLIPVYLSILFGNYTKPLRIKIVK